MLTLSIIGTFFFSVVLVLLIYKFNIPPSLSETYYNLEKWHKNSGIFFYVYLVVTVFILIIPMVSATEFAGFLCGAGLLFVGAAPAFKESFQRYVHSFGAMFSALGAVLEIFIMNKLLCLVWVLIPIIIISLLTKTYKHCIIFWLEMWAFYSLFLGLILFFI